MGRFSGMSYKTVKLVSIYDLRLVTAHFFFQLAIFTYVVLWKILHEDGFIKFSDPIGTVRLQLQGPVGDCLQYLDKAGKPVTGSCDPDYPNYHYAFRPTAELPYCANGSEVAVAGCGRAGKRCNCMHYDALSAVFPVSGGSPFYIATRVLESTEAKNASCGAASCATTYDISTRTGFTRAQCEQLCPLNAKLGGFGTDKRCTSSCWQQDDYYVAQVEDFTLLIDHSVQSSTRPSITGSSVDMHGDLATEPLDGCRNSQATCGKCADPTTARCCVAPNATKEGQDNFRLSDLLQAATREPQGSDAKPQCGIDLNAPSLLGSPAARAKSSRYDGLILILSIEYKNVEPWRGQLAPQKAALCAPAVPGCVGRSCVQKDPACKPKAANPSGITYTYKVRAVEGTKSKVSEQIFLDGQDKRLTRDIHGVKIVVLQTGQLGHFDATTLLLQLTTSLALLAASTTMVDLLMQYVLAKKKRYVGAKYQEVHDGELQTTFKDSEGRLQ